MPLSLLEVKLRCLVFILDFLMVTSWHMRDGFTGLYASHFLHLNGYIPKNNHSS